MNIEGFLALLFFIFLGLFLYIKRKNLEIQKIVPYVVYFALYRTKLGLKLMDSWSSKYPKTVRFFAYAGIIVGYLGMALIAYQLISSFLQTLFTPETAPAVGLVLPFQVKGTFYVPFFYWIISIFLLAVVHEFAHGVVARLHGVKIKSSGFAFLGIIFPVLPAAFVEPDDKQVKKLSRMKQISIYAAGPFSNVIFAGIVLLIFLFGISPLVSNAIVPTGVTLTEVVENMSAAEYGLVAEEVILSVDGVETLTVQNFTDALSFKSPGDSVVIDTNLGSHDVVLGSSPVNESRAYLGVMVSQESDLSPGFVAKYGKTLGEILLWIAGLFYWLFVLNLGIGLFNLVPIGPIDGGRILLATLQNFFEEKKAAQLNKYIGSFFFFILIALIVTGFI